MINRATARGRESPLGTHFPISYGSTIRLAMVAKLPKSSTGFARRRRFNLRLCLWLCLPILFLGFAIDILHRVQVRRNAGSLLAESKRVEARGDLGRAREYLKLFLRYNPDRVDALGKYGLILARTARSDDDRLTAMRVLERALSLDPTTADVRRRLIDVAISGGAFSTAASHLSVLLGRSEPGPGDSHRRAAPGDAELENLLGQCAEGERDYARAALWYRDAVAHDPAQITSYVRLADILRTRLHDARAADQVMDARETKDGIVAANQTSFRSYLERALYRKRYQLAGAEKDVDKALELGADEPDVLLTAAGFAIERKAYDRARGCLSRGLKKHPSAWRLANALAWVDRETGHLTEAVAILREGVRTADDPEGRSRLLWSLVDLLIDQENWGDATEEMEGLSRENVRPELLKYLTARLLAGKSRWLQAASELEGILPAIERDTQFALPAGAAAGKML